MPCSKDCICLNFIEVTDETSKEEAFLAFICDKHLEDADFKEEHLRFFREELAKIMAKLGKYELISKVRHLKLGSPEVPDRQSNTSPLKARNVSFADDNSAPRRSIQQQKVAEGRTSSSFPVPAYGSPVKATPTKVHSRDEEMLRSKNNFPRNIAIEDHADKNKLLGFMPTYPNNNGYVEANPTSGNARMSSSSLPEDDDRIVFNDFISNSKKYLRLRRIPNKNDQLDHVNAPLGVCFDEGLQQWVIADTNNLRILLYPSQVSITTELIGTPSAVCIVEPGISFAILTNSHIVVFDRRSNKFSVLWEDRHLNCRGLAVSQNGNLVTMRKIADSVFIVVLSSSKPNKQYALLPLEGVNPSFMHMVGDTVIFTDLGNQSVSKCLLDDSDVNKISLETEFVHDGYKWEGEGEEPNGKFCFVSGVQIDGHGCSLIGDARGHTIQLFDDTLKPMYRVSADFPLPYMSSFAINNNGQIMICGRQSGHLFLAQLEAGAEVLPRKEKVNLRFGGPASRSRGNRRQGY